MNESEPSELRTRLIVPESVRTPPEKKSGARPAALKWSSLSNNTPDFIVTFAEWFFHKEADDEDVEGVWWFRRKEAAHLPLLIGALVFVFCSVLYTCGSFGFLFRTGYVQDELNIVEGDCSACMHAISVFEYPDEAAREWMRALDKTKALSAEDGARGWFTIDAHWAYAGPMNVTFSNLYLLMRHESDHGHCDCAVNHGVPASIFAFNGTVYFAHHFSGVRGASVSCGMRGVNADGDEYVLEVAAASTGVVRYWDNRCGSHKADATHALMCCARLCQLPPKNLLQ